MRKILEIALVLNVLLMLTADTRASRLCSSCPWGTVKRDRCLSTETATCKRTSFCCKVPIITTTNRPGGPPPNIWTPWHHPCENHRNGCQIP